MKWNWKQAVEHGMLINKKTIKIMNKNNTSNFFHLYNYYLLSLLYIDFSCTSIFFYSVHSVHVLVRFSHNEHEPNINQNLIQSLINSTIRFNKLHTSFTAGKLWLPHLTFAHIYFTGYLVGFSFYLCVFCFVLLVWWRPFVFGFLLKSATHQPQPLISSWHNLSPRRRWI